MTQHSCELSEWEAGQTAELRTGGAEQTDRSGQDSMHSQEDGTEARCRKRAEQGQQDPKGRDLSLRPRTSRIPGLN